MRWRFVFTQSLPDRFSEIVGTYYEAEKDIDYVHDRVAKKCLEVVREYCRH